MIIDSNPIYAQKDTCTCTLSGVIHDNEHKVLPGASLVLNTGQVTNTDENGFYKFDKLCKGKYVLKCTYISFKPVEISINLNRLHNEDLDLHEHDIHLQEVVVSGKRELNPISSKIILPELDVEKNQSLGISDVLRSISGVSLLQTGTNVS
ncbi:MAG: carboxypeptidase-like regulatory domain-containing protein, partial [Leadbetterella sp.]